MKKKMSSLLVTSFIMIFGETSFAAKPSFCGCFSQECGRSLRRNHGFQEANVRRCNDLGRGCETVRGCSCNRRCGGCVVRCHTQDGWGHSREYRGCSRRNEGCGPCNGRRGAGQACGLRDRRGFGPRDGRGRPDVNGDYTCPYAER